MQSDDVDQADDVNNWDQAGDRRNRALAAALTRAAKELAKAKSQLAQLGQPPLTVALALGVDSVAYDSQGVQQARLLILNGSRRMVVPLAPNIRAERIRAGQEVLLNADMVVVRVGDQPVTGQVRTLRETLESGALLVEDPSGQTRVAARAGSLQDQPIEAGSALLMDESCSMALAVLPESDQSDMLLEETPDVDFSDIGGLDRQIERIRDAVQLPFQHADLMRRYGLQAPKGVLLYGPPGNGKTMIAKALARALAQESDGHGVFLSVKGPEVLNKFVGESERLIRRLFARARSLAGEGGPVVVFIDEMDALLRTRGSGISSDVETTIVPQFLTELDGVESLDQVMVIGASNRIDMIDPAVLRPGRLDVKIRIDRPDRTRSAAVLGKYLGSDMPMEDDAGPEDLIQVLVDGLFARDDDHLLGNIMDVTGRWQPLYLESVVSGAMLHNLIDRVKTMAVKASIEQGRQVGLDRGLCLRAVHGQYEDTMEELRGQDPDRWADLAGLRPGQVQEVRPVDGPGERS